MDIYDNDDQLSDESFDEDVFGDAGDSDEDFGAMQNVSKEIEKKDKPTIGLKHLLQMKEALNLDSFKEKSTNKREKKRRQKERKKLKKSQSGATPNIVKTLATKSGVIEVKPAEVVVFHDPRKISQKRKTEAAAAAAAKANSKTSLGQDQKLSDSELSMKQTRFEVFKFAVSGMEGAEKMDARIAQAIRLGAKPPKKPCLPLEELKAKRKAEKEEMRQRKEMQRVTGVRPTSSGRPTMSMKSSKSSSKKNSKTKDDSTKAAKKGGSGRVEKTPLKVGKFDGGMLKLSAKDLARIKRK